MIPARGRVYRADLGAGLKPFVVVSNNRRNAALDTSLAVRLTTSLKPTMASIVELQRDDPLVGRALCDDIVLLYHDELRNDLGALSRATMESIAAGLAHALGIGNVR